jgi:hypothetical protein
MIDQHRAASRLGRMHFRVGALMPTPTFKRVSRDEFEKILANFPFSRKVNAVHMHHTWRPDRASFRGHETIVSMWRFHTEKMGWSDIAQHITIDPEGCIWLGRNWNLPPASAAGHNGNASFGPFMFEMVGNFDKGHDPFDGQQRETALQVIAMVQEKFGLAADSLKFHNAMSSKSCPGNSLDYQQILTEVEQRRSAIRRPQLPAVRPDPFFDAPEPALAEAIEMLRRPVLDVQEAADAEPSHDEQGTELEQALDELTARSAPDGVRPSPAMLAALRPHIVNLSMGRFSSDGLLATSTADVNAMFDQHLPQALAQANAAGHKLRLLFYAHGGLTSESRGLQIAAMHIDWWRQNGVYPIYFIWETGLFETIGSLLKRAQQGMARGLPRDLWDFTLDPLTELAARALQGPRIWGGMKSSAEHAVDAPRAGDPIGGGAHYVASRLKAFCDAHQGQVELHAIGHSAGAVFHTHFLPLAGELGVPTFASAQFMAPALRVDTFMRMLAGRIGDNKTIRKLILFTLKQDYEKADNCVGIYHKSLLYLIFHALEETRSTPILGLEECLRGDPALAALFGLNGTPSERGEVVWSVTAADSGASASTSRTHGGFDDDPATMNSMLRRVLGKADADRIIGYRSARDAGIASDDWSDQVDWPEGFGRQRPPLPAPATALAVPAAPSLPALDHRAGAIRRRALCIGINRYPDPRHELAGCVADAQMWADTLGRFGFSTTLLTDRMATREAIARELSALIGNSRAGDVIVLQYAGHGTTLPDLNGDEDDAQDEAICPVDFADGALYIDDDIAQAFELLPDGVNLTCFMDCCHSGTNSRFAVGAPEALSRHGRDERKRYIVATPELVEAHRQFRQNMGGMRHARGTGGPSLMRDVKFAACLDSEVAWESEGHGEFTLRATRLLATGIDGLSNERFLQGVVSDFGAATRQHPQLDCSDACAALPLLQPLNGAMTSAMMSASRPALDGALMTQMLTTLQQLVAAPRQ